MEFTFKCDKCGEELSIGKDKPTRSKTEVDNYRDEITIYIQTCDNCSEDLKTTSFNEGYDEAKQNIEDEKELKDLEAKE